MMIATDAKQTPTISQAPKILKAIFKTESNGMSTSVIVTAVPLKGSVDEETPLLGVGAGSCVPYFNVGKYSSTVFHSRWLPACRA